jgi:gliding motility associated protien GldN
MKTKILLMLLLCFVCSTGFAQRKSTRKRKKPATTVKKTAPVRDKALSAQPTDTAKKVAAISLKPFDRPLDGYYRKANILNAKVIPYANIRENDVAFSKRVWREIDLREKMNQYLASPKQRLIDVLMGAIQRGELTAYSAQPDSALDPDGDGFAKPLTADQAKGSLVDSVIQTGHDASGNALAPRRVANIFNPDSLIKFRIKEDWIFDRQRSVFEPRIIGLAPMVRHKIDGATSATPAADYQPAFWIYFPDARPLLATKEVVNKNSDATNLSFDNIFMKRIFTSYIVKVSNDKDESIRNYAQGIDKLYESERIKKQLMDWELNLWQY